VRRSIFISYRRDDAEGEAGRLYDDLVRVYGDDSVFMDVAGIAPGSDFRKAIDDNVAGCGVFLAVVGPEWATIAGASGQRRLEDANDFVRLEVASALARNIAVIPVLVHEARMPHPEQLPDNIKDLAYRNSVEISHARWNTDVQLLITALKQYVTTNAVTESDPVHATVPVQLPPPVSQDPPSGAKKPKLSLILGGCLAAVILLGVIGYAVVHKSPVVPPSPVPADGGGNANPARNPSNAAGNADALVGSWRNSDPKAGADVIAEVRIDGAEGRFTAEALGNCPKGECSWGRHSITFDGVEAVGTWSPRNTPAETASGRTVLLTLRPTDGKLDVRVQNTRSNAAGKIQRDGLNYQFVREP
jgi:hypothetical protein